MSVKFGNCHEWILVGSVRAYHYSEGKETYYICKNCSSIFSHKYARIPNISDAMKVENVPSECKINSEITELLIQQVRDEIDKKSSNYDKRYSEEFREFLNELFRN